MFTGYVTPTEEMKAISKMTIEEISAYNKAQAEARAKRTIAIIGEDAWNAIISAPKKIICPCCGTIVLETDDHCGGCGY